MLLENYIGRHLTFEELMTSSQSCISINEINTKLNNSQQRFLHPVKDYTLYLIFTSLYMAFIAIVFTVFFRAQQKRHAFGNDIEEYTRVDDVWIDKSNKAQQNYQASR